MWECCPPHDLEKFREYIYCKRTGNKKFLWNSAYVHSHTKIISLLISQSSRKSARMKKIWFTLCNVDEGDSHTEVTNLCLHSTWLEACSFLGKKMFLLNYSVLLHYTCRYTLWLLSLLISVVLLPTSSLPGWMIWWWMCRNLKEKNSDYFTQMKMSFSGSVLALPTKAWAVQYSRPTYFCQ